MAIERRTFLGAMAAGAAGTGFSAFTQAFPVNVATRGVREVKIDRVQIFAARYPMTLPF